VHVLPSVASSRSWLTADRWVSSAEIADDYSMRAQRIASGWRRRYEVVARQMVADPKTLEPVRAAGKTPGDITLRGNTVVNALSCLG
jgi:hypothetical protein